MKFSKPMEYEEDMMDLVNSKRTSEDRIISLALYSEIAEGLDDNLEDWEVTDMSAT